MWVYAKNSLLDCLLCIVVSSALAYTALSGFYATQPYQDVLGTVATVGACAGMTFALFAVTINRKLSIIGGLVLAFVVLGLFGVAVGTSAVDSPMDDVVGNNLYLAFCLLLPPLATFLLSRTRPGCVVLVVLSVLFCGVMEYLYWYGHVIAFLVALVGLVALFVYRTYQVSLLDSESEHLAFGSVTAAGIALAMVAVGVGLGVFAVVVAPLDPPNLVIKLVTEHYRAEEKEVRGIGSTDDVQNDQESSEENDEVSQTNEQSESEVDPENTDDSDVEDQNSLLGTIGAGLASLTMNFPDWWPIAGVFIVIALVAAMIALRKLVRKRRFDKMVAMGGGAAVRELYLFFLSRFERLKIPQPGTMTLQEYAEGFSDTFRKFEQRLDGPDFANLTDVYVRQEYGGQDADEEELAAFTDYYKKFYKWACGYVGRLKYCRMFFRI